MPIGAERKFAKYIHWLEFELSQNEEDCLHNFESLLKDYKPDKTRQERTGQPNGIITQWSYETSRLN